MAELDKNEKTVIDDIDSSFYDFRYDENEEDFLKLDKGLTKDIVLKRKMILSGCVISDSSP